jgi:putative flippase GtrA
VHWGVLALLVQSGGLRADVAAAVGAGCGAVAAYLGNHRFAFAGTAPHMFALPRFLAVAVLSVLLSAATLLTIGMLEG